LQCWVHITHRPAKCSKFSVTQDQPLLDDEQAAGGKTIRCRDLQKLMLGKMLFSLPSYLLQEDCRSSVRDQRIFRAVSSSLYKQLLV
jgi:hypothetical protein